MGDFLDELHQTLWYVLCISYVIILPFSAEHITNQQETALQHLGMRLPHHTQLANIQLSINVWHSCKFAIDVLSNNIDGKKGVDVVKTKPGKNGKARFNTIRVRHGYG